MTQVKFVGERFPAVDGASREVLLYRAIGPAPASEEERQPKSMHPGYIPAGNVIRLVQMGEQFREVGDTDRLGDRYVAVTIDSPAPCACDGNLMPAGHLAFADCEHGHAVSAEHCEVIAEDVRVEVEGGDAFVSIADQAAFAGWEIVGIWHLGDLVDNHVSGSEPWTRGLAADALIRARADAIDSSYVDEESPATEDDEPPGAPRWAHRALTLGTMAVALAVTAAALNPSVSAAGWSLHGTLSLERLAALMLISLLNLVAHDVLDRIAGSASRWAR
jgi:hypothetical protein